MTRSRALSSFGRAPRLHRGGERFDPARVHHEKSHRKVGFFVVSYSRVPSPSFMKTLIFDIDGTLTDMWPIERAVLQSLVPGVSRSIFDVARKGRDVLSTYKTLTKRKLPKKAFREVYDRKFSALWKCGALPRPVAYPLVEAIKNNQLRFHFVCATGGSEDEARYVLDLLGLKDIFDFTESVSRNSSRFSKKSGVPLRKIWNKYPDSLFVTDSESDVEGARRAGLPAVMIKPGVLPANIHDIFS